MFEKMIGFALRRPKFVFGIAALLTFLAVVQFAHVKIDTDPENMLPENEFVRVFHREVKKEFSLYDYIVLGVVNEHNKEGVFNPVTLKKIYDITEAIKKIDGVNRYELMSLATKDDIQQGAAGEVVFQWLMKKPPYTQQEALHIRQRAMKNPLFYNTLVSQDGKAVCIYVPIEKKSLSYKVAKEIRRILKNEKGDEQYYLTGLPLAEDAFGEEMFVQMGISAPLAIIVIFLLMLWFFKNLRLVFLPILMAIDVVILTMGLMVGFGFPIHIMSSMIPIFLIPICVLDSIHLLSDFFENYPRYKDKDKTIRHVLRVLFIPNLFTSLTTMAGFFSLSFAPIPPIQVFGVFVAVGVAMAWLATVFFTPAYIALLSEKKLEGFGATHEQLQGGVLSRSLVSLGRFTLTHAKGVLVVTVAIVLLSLYGISKIHINDNPTKWFAKRHPIRVADIVLNRHFGGTYSVYLIFDTKDKEKEVFKEPAMLTYIQGLQEYLYRQGEVGKSTSLADVTQKVYYELTAGATAGKTIPPTKPAVAQCLLSFENSHKPDDLWHFVTPDYSRLNVWLQLRSGDNQDMSRVVTQVEKYLRNNPPPYELSYHWSGLTYINMVWQNKMVVGMLWNFMGSFIIVLLMMIILLRSAVAALISMIPMSVTILFIYSILGFIGKEYDMPVAVLSALTLGLSIDFAIHFIERAKALYAQKGSWPAAAEEMFLAPYRAILRNALVVSIGFLPLFVSPLVPYNTVGFFMFAIMLCSSIGTLVIMPAMVTVFPGAVFKAGGKKFLCSCTQCLIVSVIAGISIAYVLVAYLSARWNIAAAAMVGVVAVLSVVCFFVSKSKACEVQNSQNMRQ